MVKYLAFYLIYFSLITATALPALATCTAIRHCHAPLPLPEAMARLSQSGQCEPSKKIGKKIIYLYNMLFIK
jgi:hypothetical protein